VCERQTDRQPDRLFVANTTVHMQRCKNQIIYEAHIG